MKYLKEFRYDYIDFGEYIDNNDDRFILWDGTKTKDDYYFSNTSIVELSKSMYLYSVKAIRVDTGIDVIPGNSICPDNPSMVKIIGGIIGKVRIYMGQHYSS